MVSGCAGVSAVGYRVLCYMPGVVNRSHMVLFGHTGGLGSLDQVLKLGKSLMLFYIAVYLYYKDTISFPCSLAARII